MVRSLRYEELRIMFCNILKYIGENISDFIQKVIDLEIYFRLYRKRISFSKKKLINNSNCFTLKKIASVGVFMGKFFIGKRFLFFISFINVIKGFDTYKYGVVSSHGEKHFTKGNNLKRSHFIKISNNFVKGDGIFIKDNSNNILGFGLTTKDYYIVKSNHPNLLLINFSDVGIYIRIKY